VCEFPNFPSLISSHFVMPPMDVAPTGADFADSARRGWFGDRRQDRPPSMLRAKSPGCRTPQIVTRGQAISLT
jgi:hypothetical protein